MKPVIGIVAKPGYKVDEDIWYRMDIVDEIRYLIIQNGGIAINILPTDKTITFNDNDINDHKELTEEEKNDLYQVVDKCDGIVLQGGLVSCKYEIEVAKRALELNIPIIGICAGFNNILRAIGTDVIQDKTESHNFYDINYRHNITFEKDTIMYEIVGKERMQVNSIHEMIAKREIIEPFVKVSSFSDDGLVESFELPDKKFVLGIKWHPELMMSDASTQKLFKRFVKECKKIINDFLLEYDKTLLNLKMQQCFIVNTTLSFGNITTFVTFPKFWSIIKKSFRNLICS